MTRQELSVAWGWARRELRGGIKGFRIFLACLILGVAAIAAVRSLSAAFLQGISQESRSLLGGDVVVGLTHRPVDAAERTFISSFGTVSAVAEMQAMARAVPSEERTIVELKAVAKNYPLFGAVVLTPESDLQSLLARDASGVWGAVADPLLMDRLKLRVGDVVRIGTTEFRIRAAIEKEPDAAAGLYTLGPRVAIAEAALADTGLVVPGSLIRYTYRVAMNDHSDEALDTFKDQANEAFPQAGWRITDRRSAAPRLKSLVGRISVFLTFVGLTTLIVGGVGVGNAIRAYLATKTETIATLKCLGVKTSQILALYLLQILVFASVAIVFGLALGALVPFALRNVLSGLFPVGLAAGLYPLALAEAAFYGFVTAIIFALGPLACACNLPPGALFRSLVAGERGKLPVRVLAITAGLFVLLAAAIIGFSKFHFFAAGFVVGAAITFTLLRGLGWALIRIAKQVPRPSNVELRLALSNLHRPGAPTAVIVLSLGFGLTLLGGLALVGGNVRSQIADELPRDVPALFMIGIVKEDAEAFDRLVRAWPGVSELNRVANIRGRIVAVNGVRSADVKPKPDGGWVLRGDQGLTYAAALPKGSTITSGEWWSENYSGPPLISFYNEAADSLGVKVGDTLTINILGRELTAKIANLRDIDWSYRGFNYVVIYSPGVLDAAPFSFVANVRVTPDAESGLYRAVTDVFPSVSVVRSRDAIQSILKILDQLALGVRLTSLVALTAGALVLAGALAAGYQARVYDSVVLKVLGATRRRILTSYLIEFGILGTVVGLLAAGLASAIAFLIIHFVMEENWVFLPGGLAMTLLAGILVTAGLGLVATWKALGERPAAVLRQV